MSLPVHCLRSCPHHRMRTLFSLRSWITRCLRFPFTPMPPCFLVALSLCHFATLPLCHCSVTAADFAPQQIEFFETEVRPLLVKRCHECHGPDEQEAGLRLDSRAAILKGGDTGAALVPGEPEESELIRAVRYDPDGYQMPPDGKLPAKEIETLTRWVQMGAPWPAGDDAAAIIVEDFDLAERAKRWSFQPLTKPPVPPVPHDVIPAQAGIRATEKGVRHHFVDSAVDSQPARPDEMVPDPVHWCRNPIDRFILAKLLENGLTPARTADAGTLLRRASFDVLGLPPSPEQVEAFVSDDTAGAYERLVDELLASPHFGERWGRHWLDLVRYAESRGHEFDFDVANAHQYRDYVIRALNDDVPYDQYVVEHVAGDLLVSRTESEALLPRLDSPFISLKDRPGLREFYLGRREFPKRFHPLTGADESILGTGFWFLGEWVHSPVDVRADEADRFANMIDAYSKTFLGLTVACARCHDHKFDPITTQDFYALQGYLQSSTYRQAHFETESQNQRIARELDDVCTVATYELAEIIYKAATPAIESLDSYLLAADEVMALCIGPGVGSSGFATPLPANSQLDPHVENVANERRLDPVRLKSWVQHLCAASRDVNDPFHLWTKLDSEPQMSLESFRSAAEAAVPSAARTEIAWDDLAQQQWTSDWDLWSDSPAVRRVAAGDILLSDDPANPIDGLSEFTCIEFNSDFDGVSSAPHSIPEPGALGALQTSGRAIRTPSFEITSGNLYLDLKGPVTTYVVVDSHRLIKGPLHGKLVKKHADNRDWHTVYHDVSRYVGHRAHIEIYGQRGKPFAVREVRELPKQVTGDSVYSIIDRLEDTERFFDPQLKSITRRNLAEAYRDMFVYDMHSWWEATRLYVMTAVPSEVEIPNWVVQRPHLFGLDAKEYLTQVREIGRPLVTRRRQLLTQIRSESSTAPVMSDSTGEDEYVFIRGAWKKPGVEVSRRFLEVFSGREMVQSGAYPGKPHSARFSRVRPEIRLSDGSISGGATLVGDPEPLSGRLQLSQWMVNPDKTPILPRAIVNRIWQHYFGVGIVPTPDDFGYMGQDPSHPELLDWLASELVEHDWSLKHIHRLILTSATYRMASDVDGKANPASSTDPDNRLLSRQNVKRLEGEAIRDAILTLSGRLDRRFFGKSVPVHLTSFLEGRGRPKESGPVDGAGRRSVYIAVRRNFPEPFFQAFDMPNPHTTVGRRNVSNVPAQALAMMNNPLVVEQARRWGERVVSGQTRADVDARIRRMYRAAFSRLPSDEEIRRGREFLTRQAEDLGTDTDDARVWSDYCHTLFNTKEFLFVR